MTSIDHTAVLVRDLDGFLKMLPNGCKVGDIEDQPAEGTREVYVGGPESNTSSLLVVQPVRDGPYQSALDRRGQGIHHVCITTPDIGAFGRELATCRVFLHPVSLQTLGRGTLWLCRPGVPLLIEVVQFDQPPETPRPFVQSVGAPMTGESLEIARALLGPFIARRASREVELGLLLDGRQVAVSLPPE
jgi:hypothetical protein